jgi:hypothetical protein
VELRRRAATMLLFAKEKTEGEGGKKKEPEQF